MKKLNTKNVLIGLAVVGLAFVGYSQFTKMKTDKLKKEAQLAEDYATSEKKAVVTK